LSPKEIRSPPKTGQAIRRLARYNLSGATFVGFQSILSYVPELGESPEVVACSARLARECEAKLALAEVLTPLPVYLREPNYGYEALSDTLEREAKERLQRSAAALREGGLDVSTAVLTGKPHEELVREALRSGHDLVVASGPPQGALIRSASTAVRLCRLCPVPVLAISPEHGKPFRRILATVDPLSADQQGQELNERVLETALEVARLEDGEVSVLFVWGENLPPAGLELYGEAIRQLAESALHNLLEPYGDEIDTNDVLLEFGEPSTAICRVAQDTQTDLVVMGTIARTGVQALWIGNTAEKTLAQLDVSVLAVKPSAFVSPLDPRS
jgi:universal stress protein E